MKQKKPFVAQKYLYALHSGLHGYGLRHAAAALRADAKHARHCGDGSREFIRALEYSADRLAAMANGQSAAAAFGWPTPTAGESQK